MKASVYHVQLNVTDATVSLPFYRDLLGYFEYRVVMGAPDLLGMSNGTTDFWILPAAPEPSRLHGTRLICSQIVTNLSALHAEANARRL